jgi:serine/threonine protein phosphatase PrpC
VIPVKQAHLYVAAHSHPGSRRRENEDRYGVSAFVLDDASRTPALLAVLADGIGGHRAGEVAAEMAVETISRMVAESDGSQPLQTLQQAIIAASQMVHTRAEADPDLTGMGSTVACAWVIGMHLFTASVGDSRIYLVRDGAMHQVTTDHTWVQEAIEQGRLTPEQARLHPNAHVIRRYLGSSQDVVPDTRLRLQNGESDSHARANQGVALQPGDLLLLCSDGLTDLVSDDEILASLVTRSLKDALEELVLLANRRGGHDNITIVSLRVPVLEKQTIPIGKRRQRSRLLVAGLVGLALLLVALVVVGGAFWAFNRPRPLDTPLATQMSLTPGATLPAALISPSGLPPVTTATVEAPGSTPAFTPPSQATLTPWPTNTLPPP